MGGGKLPGRALGNPHRDLAQTFLSACGAPVKTGSGSEIWTKVFRVWKKKFGASSASPQKKAGQSQGQSDARFRFKPPEEQKPVGGSKRGKKLKKKLFRTCWKPFSRKCLHLIHLFLFWSYNFWGFFGPERLRKKPETRWVNSTLLRASVRPPPHKWRWRGWPWLR